MISFVCGGGWHSAILLDSGVLLTAGSNRYGQLGRMSLPLNRFLPCDLPNQSLTESQETRVSKFAMGGEHTIVLLNDGRVACCGWGEDDQLLGVNPQREYSLTVTRCIPKGNYVKNIVCGTWSSVLELAVQSQNESNLVYRCTSNEQNETKESEVLSPGLYACGRLYAQENRNTYLPQSNRLRGLQKLPVSTHCKFLSTANPRKGSSASIDEQKCDISSRVASQSKQTESQTSVTCPICFSTLVLSNEVTDETELHEFVFGCGDDHVLVVNEKGVLLDMNGCPSPIQVQFWQAIASEYGLASIPSERKSESKSESKNLTKRFSISRARVLSRTSQSQEDITHAPGRFQGLFELFKRFWGRREIDRITPFQDRKELIVDGGLQVKFASLVANTSQFALVTYMDYNSNNFVSCKLCGTIL